MELGLQFEDIFCYEATAGITSAHEESLETAIPEYCPDITRIVDVAGHLSIREKLLSEDRCTISGSVRVTILYTSEEATGLRSLTMSVPFSCMLDDRALDRCSTVCVNGRVLLAEARAVSSRKVYIKVLPEITVVGYRAVKRRLCCNAQEESSIRKRCLTASVNLLTAIGEKGFSFTSEIMLENGVVPEDILMHCMRPKILSTQRLGNKLMVKGEMGFWVLYRGEGQTLHQHDALLPFSQILDVAELPEDAVYQLSPQLEDCDIRVLRTDGGNGFGLTARVDICILSFQNRTVSYVEDLYSTRFDTETERQGVTFPLMAPVRTMQQEAQLKLELEGHEPFISVTDVDCSSPEILPAENGLTLRTTLHIRLLYLDESGAPVSTERTTEVNAVVERVDGAVTACCGAALSQFNGSTCLVRIPVYFLLGSTGEATLSGITSVTLNEAQSSDGPSLILCRMGTSETLWDIAKRYHTDEDAIRSANCLEGDDARDSYMLLIPKVR